MHLRSLFSDFNVEVLRIFSVADTVVSRVRYRGHHSGDFPGLTAVGAPIDLTGLDVFYFQDGRVVEHLHEADHEAMWEQLGVALPG